VPLPKSPARSPDPSSSRTSLSVSKLRYAAYEPPQAVPRLQCPSSSRRSYSNGSRSPTYSDHGGKTNRGLSVTGEDSISLDELSRTITSGNLSLAAGDIELETIPKVSRLLRTRTSFLIR